MFDRIMMRCASRSRYPKWKFERVQVWMIPSVRIGKTLCLSSTPGSAIDLQNLNFWSNTRWSISLLFEHMKKHQTVLAPLGIQIDLRCCNSPGDTRVKGWISENHHWWCFIRALSCSCNQMTIIEKAYKLDQACARIRRARTVRNPGIVWSMLNFERKLCV